MSDGNLRQLFQKHLPLFHWQAIETGSTGRGIPDLNYCFEGREGWIELKVTSTQAVGLRPEQIGWLQRRARAGGRCFIAVRFLHGGGPRKGPEADELWIFEGPLAQQLAVHGLPKDEALRSTFKTWDTRWAGGPKNWDWPAIQALLIAP